MATDDVPGSNPANGDELKTGCWAEDADGSLIFVAGFEKGTVTYQVFDVSTTPITEYRDRMAEKGFRDLFVNRKNWVWHDKTPFDWERVVKQGARPGPGFASAHDELSAAARLAKSLNLEASELNEREARRQGTLHGWEEKAPKFLRAFADLIDTVRGMGP